MRGEGFAFLAVREIPIAFGDGGVGEVITSRGRAEL